MDPRKVHTNSGAKPLEAGQNEGEGYSHHHTRHRKQCLGLRYSGEPTIEALSEYLHLWNAVLPTSLRAGTEDIIIWKLTASQVYSAKLVYNALFLGSIDFAGHKPIWKAWASKCKFFIWLAVHNRCWTADWLQRRGLPNHGVCEFCSQELETVDRLFVACNWVRQFWRKLLHSFGLSRLAPVAINMTMLNWWLAARNLFNKDWRKDFNSLVILAVWMIWCERNARVFEGKSLQMADFMSKVLDKTTNWRQAGVERLSNLI